MPETPKSVFSANNTFDAEINKLPTRTITLKEYREAAGRIALSDSPVHVYDGINGDVREDIAIDTIITGDIAKTSDDIAVEEIAIAEEDIEKQDGKALRKQIRELDKAYMAKRDESLSKEV